LNLNEIEALLQECQSVIRNQAKRQEQLMTSNLTHLEKKLATIKISAENQLQVS
jgi:hypothetical protein